MSEILLTALGGALVGAGITAILGVTIARPDRRELARVYAWLNDATAESLLQRETAQVLLTELEATHREAETWRRQRDEARAQLAIARWQRATDQAIALTAADTQPLPPVQLDDADVTQQFNRIINGLRRDADQQRRDLP